MKLDAGDAAGAVADARRAVALLEGLTSRDGGQWFGLACAGRRWPQPPAALETPGPPMPAPWLTGQWSDLRRAAAMGYRNLAQYRYEPALGPLRPRADFRLLILDLSFPAEAFAR